MTVVGSLAQNQCTKQILFWRMPHQHILGSIALRAAYLPYAHEVNQLTSNMTRLSSNERQVSKQTNFHRADVAAHTNRTVPATLIDRRTGCIIAVIDRRAAVQGQLC